MDKAIRPCVLFAAEQYKLWLFSPRILLIVYIIIFMNENLTSNMLNICGSTGYTLNPAEPLALMFSKSVNTVIIPIVYLALMTGFPRTHDRLFFISRMSRSGWVFGELLFSLMSSLTYTLSLIAGTALFCAGKCAVSNEWSEYTTALYIEHPEIYRENVHLFLTSATYTQGKPLEVILNSALLITLYTFFISLVIMLFKQINRGELGIIAGAALTLCGLATDSGAAKLMWAFPITHTVYGWHYNIFMREPYFSLGGSYLYFAVIIGILLAADIILSERVNLP